MTEDLGDLGDHAYTNHTYSSIGIEIPCVTSVEFQLLTNYQLSGIS